VQEARDEMQEEKNMHEKHLKNARNTEKMVEATKRGTIRHQVRCEKDLKEMIESSEKEW
jgi:sugar-specific transcriptional regulator TrmB